MCIRVQYAPRHLLEEPWDTARQVVTLPAELNPAFGLRALLAVLSELHIEQGAFGARCWCGEPIRLLPRVPQQRRSGQVVTHHGA